MKKHIVKFVFLLCFVFILYLPSYAKPRQPEVYVIVNSRVKYYQISKSDVKNIFLGRKKFLKGYRLKVFFLPMESNSTKIFAKEVLKIPYSKFKQRMRELSNSGRAGIPRQLTSSTKMLLKVANTRGGIGFIRGSWLIFDNGKLIHRLKVKE